MFLLHFMVTNDSISCLQMILSPDDEASFSNESMIDGLMLDHTSSSWHSSITDWLMMMYRFTRVELCFIDVLVNDDVLMMFCLSYLLYHGWMALHLVLHMEILHNRTLNSNPYISNNLA